MNRDNLTWQYVDANGVLLYQDELLKATVKGSNIKHDDNLAKYGINPFILEEWIEYRIILHDPKNDHTYDGKDTVVLFGGHKADHDEDGKFWSFTFKNYVGKSQIEIRAGNHYLPVLDVEVISPKLHLSDANDELYYPNFCHGLISRLIEYQLTLPFQITSPTYITVEDIPVPPNFQILFKRIVANSMSIIDGINTILASPHRDLITEESLVKLHEVDRITPDVCISVVCSSEQLVKSKSSNLQIASKLKGFIPERILQFRNVETLNVPENRFVKSFLRDLLQKMQHIEDLKVLEWKIPENEKTEWLRIKTGCQIALLSECFREVGNESCPPPLMSQILLKKEGYRDILKVYNELLLSKSPIFTYLDEKINERNIAEMYEFWCFFELSTELASSFNVERKIEVETTLEGALAQSKVKTTLGDLQLIYNKKFYRSNKGSYSVPLKPDYSLEKNNQIMVAFDAKFRFHGIPEEKPLEDDQEEALGEMKIDRIAEISDIFKMHTYKDALGANSAVILYPGNKHVFYSKQLKQKSEGTFKQIFKRICDFEEGIAYLAFVPKSDLSYRKPVKPVV